MDIGLTVAGVAARLSSPKSDAGNRGQRPRLQAGAPHVAQPFSHSMNGPCTRTSTVRKLI